jgi:hypothetical protein
MSPVPHQIATDLAHALRLQGRCLCHSKSSWPWKRDEQCGMCRALAAWDACGVAQAPVVSAEALVGRE